MDVLQNREGITCKSPEPLPKAGSVPAAFTARMLHAGRSLLAFGTSHSFGLF